MRTILVKLGFDFAQVQFLYMALSFVAPHASISVLDSAGDIVSVNRSWKAFGDRNGVAKPYPAEGKNYEVRSQQASDDYGDRVTAELRRLLTDEQTEFTVEYPCDSPNQDRWFRLYATAISLGDEPHYLLVHQQLEEDPTATATSPSDAEDAQTRTGDTRDPGRLVTYKLSADESASHGIFMAFDALGIDVQKQDSTLGDWIDPDIVDSLRTKNPEIDIEFTAWNHQVGLNTHRVIIYTPEDSSE